ncbi:MAG: hypothetical protein DELT_01945 [Desulfovibrio sp.]
MDTSQENAAQSGQQPMEQPGVQPGAQSAAPKAGLDIGSVISRSFATLMKNPIVFFGLSFAVMIPPALLGAIMPHDGAASAFVKLLEMILGCIVQGAIAYTVYQVMQNKIVGVGEAIGRGTATLVPLILTSILATLGIALGAMLLIVPGIILMCIWFVAIPACVVERTGPVDSLKRSAFLTKGYRWQIFALVLITIVLLMVLVGAVSFLIAAITGSYLLATVIAAIVGVVPQAFSSVLYAIVYYDLRVLKEGISLSSLTSVFD